MRKRQWMIVNSTTGYKLNDTLLEAVEAAKNAAKKNIGETYLVLESVAEVTCEIPEPSVKDVL